MSLQWKIYVNITKWLSNWMINHMTTYHKSCRCISVASVKKSHSGDYCSLLHDLSGRPVGGQPHESQWLPPDRDGRSHQLSQRSGPIGSSSITPKALSLLRSIQFWKCPGKGFFEERPKPHGPVFETDQWAIHYPPTGPDAGLLSWSCSDICPRPLASEQ